jgi:Zn ribbon nucleic-acid-binding protein
MCLITYRENWIEGQACPYCNGPLKEYKEGCVKAVRCVKCGREIVRTEITPSVEDKK